MTTELALFASKARSDNTLYGPIHRTIDSARYTACEQRIDDRWIILAGTTEATCKLCLAGKTIHDAEPTQGMGVGR